MSGKIKKRFKLALLLLPTIFLMSPAVTAAAEKAWISSNTNFDTNTNTADKVLSGFDLSDYTSNTPFTYNSATEDIPLATTTSKDGIKVYTSGDITVAAESIKIINTVSNTVQTLALPAGINPMSTALSPDESRLYIGTFDNAVLVVNTATLVVEATIDDTGYPEFNDVRWVTVAPNGDIWALAQNSGQDALFKIDPLSNTIAAGPFVSANNTPGDNYILGAINVSMDGTKIYSTCRIETSDGVNPSTYQDALCIYDIANDSFSYIGGQALSSPPVFDPLEGLVISPDGKYLYKADFYNNSLAVFDLTAETLVTRIPVGDSPNGVDITADGSRVLVVNSRYNELVNSGDFSLTSTVSVINTADNTVVQTLSLPGIFAFNTGSFIGGTNAAADTPGSQPGAVASLADTGLSQLTVLISAAAVLIGAGFIYRKYATKQLK